MKTFQIRIKDAAQKDIEIFKNAINHYAGTLQFLIETLEKRRYAKDLSIAIELWYELDKKTTGQHPAQNPKIKLSLHKAYILLDSLKEYSRNDVNDYDRSRCNRFFMEIDQQLPTYTQLAIH